LSEPYRGLVALAIGREKAGEPGRAAQQQREHTGRHRIERAGMADAWLAERTTRERDNVM
jgi:hypothetical protein